MKGRIASCLANLRGSKAAPKRFLNNVQAWLRALCEGTKAVRTFSAFVRCAVLWSAVSHHLA